MPTTGNGANRQQPDDNAAPLVLVVGFRNYRNVDVLRRGITAYNQRIREAGTTDRPWQIAGAQTTAQAVFNEAVTLDADLVLLNPLIEGYHPGLINDLMLLEKKPVPILGMVADRSGLGREMVNNGAAGSISLPLDDASIAAFLGNAEKAVNAAWRDRAQGKAQYAAAALAGADDLSYERKTIAVWVPKGGGSTRTTIATNIAVALSHVTLGNQTTILVDLDMTKGDCHTLLGFTNQDSMAARGYTFLQHDLHTLIARVNAEYERLKNQEQDPARALDALDVNSLLVNWRKGQSRLMLVPGLTSSAQAASKDLRKMGLMFNIASQLIKIVSRRATFVILDLGQDFTRPFHRAALELADEVLVPVPPIRTAILDTHNALAPLKAQMGSLDKFRLVLTAYDAAFGITKAQIAQALMPLTKVSTDIPFDALTANKALNQAEPIVLMDRNGPLGRSLINLASIYYPAIRLREKKPGIKGKLESFIFKGA